MWRRIGSSRAGGQMEESIELWMVIVCAIMFVNYDYKGITTTMSRGRSGTFISYSLGHPRRRPRWICRLLLWCAALVSLPED